MANVRYPIEMVRGVPVVAVPAEIDVGNADWLRAVLWEAAVTGIDQVIPNFAGLDEALQPAPADPAPLGPRQRPKDRMRHTVHRQPADPGASTSPA